MTRTRCMDYPRDLRVGYRLKIAGSMYEITSIKENLDGTYSVYASEKHYESVIWLSLNPTQLIEVYVEM